MRSSLDAVYATRMQEDWSLSLKSQLPEKEPRGWHTKTFSFSVIATIGLSLTATNEALAHNGELVAKFPPLRSVQFPGLGAKGTCLIASEWACGTGSKRRHDLSRDICAAVHTGF